MFGSKVILKLPQKGMRNSKGCAMLILSYAGYEQLVQTGGQ